MSKSFFQKSFFGTKIFRQIFFIFSISITVLVLIYSYATILIQKNSSLEVLHSKASTLASSISLVCNDAMIKDDMSFIVEYNMDVIAKNKEILAIIITNRSNNNLKITKKGWRVFHHKKRSLKQMEKRNESFAIEYNAFLNKDIFHYCYPVKLPGLDWGYIHIIYSLDSYYNSLKQIYKSILILLSLLFLATLIVSFIVSRKIAQPILQLSEAAQKVSMGNLNIRVHIQSNDEIGELAKNFNIMVDKLEDSHEELEGLVSKRTQELEQLNKELDHRIKKAIEENSKKEQMLIHQSRLAAMGEMIGNIAHQWRQPLNALGLVVQNIYYNYEEGTLTKEYLEKSMNKSKKLTTQMSKTIDDFRNFFRPEKLKEVFSVSERVLNACELISASYKSHNITIIHQLDDTLFTIGYPNEFSQVLLNILTNAKDVLIEREINNPTVWIRSYLKDDNFILEIEDNGGGIDESIINKIFDPYFTTKDKNIGTGIGLYMSKMIIENNMGGIIFAFNGKKGAIFKITMKNIDQSKMDL